MHVGPGADNPHAVPISPSDSSLRPVLLSLSVCDINTVEWRFPPVPILSHRRAAAPSVVARLNQHGRGRTAHCWLRQSLVAVVVARHTEQSPGKAGRQSRFTPALFGRSLVLDVAGKRLLFLALLEYQPLFLTNTL